MLINQKHLLTHQTPAYRWSLYSHMVSVRPSIWKTTGYIKNALQRYMGSGGSLWGHLTIVLIIPFVSYTDFLGPLARFLNSNKWCAQHNLGQEVLHLAQGGLLRLGPQNQTRTRTRCRILRMPGELFKSILFKLFIFWSTMPVVITIFTQSVPPSVRPKTSKSSDNHCRPGLWAGRVDHWWLLSCIYIFIFILMPQDPRSLRQHNLGQDVANKRERRN